MIFNVIYTPAQSPSVLCPSVVDTNALNFDPEFWPNLDPGLYFKFRREKLENS